MPRLKDILNIFLLVFLIRFYFTHVYNAFFKAGLSGLFTKDIKYSFVFLSRVSDNQCTCFLVYWVWYFIWDIVISVTGF
jgi:hypothetical protein